MALFSLNHRLSKAPRLPLMFKNAHIMSEIYRIIIVDDHQIFRTGLNLVLNGLKNYKVVGQAGSAKELLLLLKKETADIIFMDIQLPDTNGIELTRMIKEKYPQTKIIALTMFGEIEYFNNMMEAGANGFLLKKADNQELVDAIDTVMEDDYYFSKEFSNTFLGQKLKEHKKIDVGLSKREQEVLQLICDGLSTSEIAEKLYLSSHTVENHRRNIMIKTGTKNTAILVKLTITNHLLNF